MGKTAKDDQINEANDKKATRIPDDQVEQVAGGIATLGGVFEGQKSGGGNLGSIKKPAK